MATDISSTERLPISHAPFALSSGARNLFVWGTWGLLFLSALIYVWKYSHDIPFTDDWFLSVPIITGQQPLTLTWLWHQHVQHRIPLQLLMLHAGQWIGVTDLRAAFYFYVCAMGILAFVMIMLAKRLRGRASYADAFFPLALMHLGRPENLLMPTAFYYSVPLFLLGVLLLVIVGWGTNLTLGRAVIAGICLVLLSLCGSTGMLCLPLPVLWLGYVAIHKLRSAQPIDVRCGCLILAFVLFALLIVWLYFRNFNFGTIEEIPGYSGQGDSVRTRLKRGVQVLAGSLGMGAGAQSFADSLWKFSGLAVAALLLISAVLLIVTLWNQPRERSRALGLLLFVGFVGCYGLVLGWERRNVRDYYSTFPALGLCCMYYLWGLYASARVVAQVVTPAARPAVATWWSIDVRLGSLAQGVLFAFICAIYPLNTYDGLRFAWWSHFELKEPMEQALRAAAPPYKIIRYHRDAFWWGVFWDEDFRMLTSMRDAGCGNFRYMGKNPPFREVPLSLTPTAVKGLTWDGATARVSGEDDYLIFPVPERKLVAGVRITYIHSGDAGGRPALSAFRLFWKRSDQKEFPSDQSFSLPVPWLETGPEERTTERIWIDETIDQVRIHPDDKPCSFKILKILLIVPAEQ